MWTRPFDPIFRFMYHPILCNYMARGQVQPTIDPVSVGAWLSYGQAHTYYETSVSFVENSTFTAILHHGLLTNRLHARFGLDFTSSPCIFSGMWWNHISTKV